VVTLHRRSGWKIAVYGRDHGVPHFHIEGPGYRCAVDIMTLRPIIGTAPQAVMRAACAWARDNQSRLMTTWLELNGA
jgi:hypothetical protein